MKYSSGSHVDDSSASFWQILGKFSLHSKLQVGAEVTIWAKEILASLDLPEDIQAKANTLMLKASKRTLQLEPWTESEPVELVILVQRNRPKTGRSWGTFWLAKGVEPGGETSTPTHTIELYLYVEPQGR